MKKTFIALILLLTVVANIFASPLHSKLKHTIIIDTDCSSGDLRAISILLSNPSFTVKAIMISDGKIPSEEGFITVQSLLQQFDADTIPVATWKQNSLKKYLSPADTQLTVICMGPLTGIAKKLEDKAFRKNVADIIWYIDSVEIGRAHV